ncbi:uncharacterized protein LOC129280145 [Lytechinus pictus]|uniref:uncharacterized protein LOC129280145 n=1 Tax=Lytechinus pictus TaxID=7653 RepID=UPI0030BA0EC8
MEKHSSYGKQYCTFNNALRCHPTIVAQSASGVANQGWKIYRSPKSKDYYVGITCPRQCWQNIRVYSNVQAYNGVATLTFYYYIWETKEKEGDRLLPQLRIKGCNNGEIWRSTDYKQSHETGEWIGVVVPIYCSNIFSIIFEGIMTSGGQVIAVDNVAITDGRTFSNVLPQPSISVVHPTIPPGSPVVPSQGTRPAGSPPGRPPQRPTYHLPHLPPVTDQTTATTVSITKSTVLDSLNETSGLVPSTAIEGGASSGKGDSSAIPKLLVALALCICSLTLCVHCIIYRKQKKCHNMSKGHQPPRQSPISGQLSSASSVCEIVITDHSRNSWAINQSGGPDIPGTSQGLTVDHLTTNDRPRLATCTLGSKAFNSHLTRVNSELRPSGRASSLPSRPTPNIYESIDEVKSSLSSHPSNFFLNLSKRSSFVKKVVHTLELPFRKNHLEKSRNSALGSKDRSLSDVTGKSETSRIHKRAFRKSNSHSAGIRFFPTSMSSLNSQNDNGPSPSRPNLSPTLPNRPMSNIFGKTSSRIPGLRTSLSKSRSHSDVNTAVSTGRKLLPSSVSPYSCSKLPNISFELGDSRPSVLFAKSSAETSPNHSIVEEPNETTSSSRISEHFYHDLDSQFRPTVSANLYHVLDPTSFESSSSSEDEDLEKKISTVKRNTVLQRTESGYTIVSKSSYNSDFENSVGSNLSNIQSLDRVYFRLESLDNPQHDNESEFGARDGLLEHEFDMSCDMQRRSNKYGRRVSDLETTCTLSMYEESGRLLDETDISSTIDDRPDVLRGVRA